MATTDQKHPELANKWACRWCGDVIEMRNDGLDEDRILEHRIYCPVGPLGRRSMIWEPPPWEQ